MSKPGIIAVAITGSVPRKRDNPALPVTVAEQIESTHAAHEAGAALVHMHVRNDDETPSSDPDKFAAFLEGIRRYCPGWHGTPVDRQPLVDNGRAREIDECLLFAVIQPKAADRYRPV